MERLKKQMEFIIEVDKLKDIIRQTNLTNGERKENDAEHSWHLALMAVFLSEYAKEPVDVLQVIKMVLIHDLVEIDAGDTYLYDEAGNGTKAAREQKAAERIFNILPGDQAEELFKLWQEFEDRKTPESKFANTLDRIQPVLLNEMCIRDRTYGGMLNAVGLQNPGVDVMIKRDLPFLKAVSYTHLDVYKRQVMCTRYRQSPTLRRQN